MICSAHRIAEGTQNRGDVGVISVNAAVSRPGSARRAASVNEPTGDAALSGAGAERELPRETAEEHNCQAKWKLATRESLRFHRDAPSFPHVVTSNPPSGGSACPSVKVTGG